MGETQPTMRMVDDFPAPLGPRKPKASPVRTSKSIPSTAVKSPNRLVRPWATTRGRPGAPSEVEAAGSLMPARVRGGWCRAPCGSAVPSLRASARSMARARRSAGPSVRWPPVARLRLFASAREAAGTGRDVVDGSTVADVLSASIERYGAAFAAVLPTCRVWVNGEPAEPDVAVGETDEVALLPPVSGG